MNKTMNIYVCPVTRTPLRSVPVTTKGAQVVTGQLVSDNGTIYAIDDGIPDITYPKALEDTEKEALQYYEGVAKVYDEVADLSFRIQKTEEVTVRKSLVEVLQLAPDSKVLELACGTGRDSMNIVEYLSDKGQFYLQDLSRSMLVHCRNKLKGCQASVEFSVGNACYLPFPDHYFDAVFSFGGLGVFGDIRRCMREIVRVAKVGAKVAVGDESLGPWLYDSEYGRVLLNNNPLFKNPLPLAELPVEARHVTVKWVVGAVYYLINFEVGSGEPEADFDLEVPGKRGGTLRTRYKGRLEGVTPKTYKLAEKARDKSGKSMHRWLDDVVREAAKRELRSK